MNREERTAWLKKLMANINSNKGTINCAHVALCLDDILNIPEIAETTPPVPTSWGRLRTNPVFNPDGTVFRSFCADTRILNRCISERTDGIVSDLSNDQEVLLLDEDGKAPDNKKIKLTKFNRKNATELLRGLYRDQKGTAKGFIFYRHKNVNMGHIANFFVDENNEVYFLDAQHNNPNDFVLSEPPVGFQEEFFYVQCKPKGGFRLKVEPTVVTITTKSETIKMPDKTSAAQKNMMLRIDDISPEAARALPAHIKELHSNAISPAAVRALPAHITRLFSDAISPAAVRELPSHIKVLITSSISIAAAEVVPQTIEFLMVANLSHDIARVLPTHLKRIYCKVNANEIEEIKQILKSRGATGGIYNSPPAKTTKTTTTTTTTTPQTIFNPRDAVARPPAQTTTTTTTTTPQTISNPTHAATRHPFPTTTTTPQAIFNPRYAVVARPPAQTTTTTSPYTQQTSPMLIPYSLLQEENRRLQEENQRLRKRLLAAESLSNAQTETIATLRSELDVYENPKKRFKLSN